MVMSYSCLMLRVCMCVLLFCFLYISFFFFKQKTAYEMRISDWSSDVCSSDLLAAGHHGRVSFGHAKLLKKLVHLRIRLHVHPGEIGRASCRERVCQYV